MECYLTIKRKEVLKRNLDGLETIMLSETNQSQKTTYYEMFRMWKTIETTQVRGCQVLGKGGCGRDREELLMGRISSGVMRMF